MAESRDEGIEMEREELAALRATRLAAERQTPSGKAWEARLSVELGAPDGLPPYVLADSCSDPRDRRVPEDLRGYRLLEQFPPEPHRPVPRRGAPHYLRATRRRFEAPPVSASWVVTALLLVAVLWFAFQLAGRLLLY